MRTHRWILAAAVLCILPACRHVGDWKHEWNAPATDDCTMRSVKEEVALFKDFFPPRGYYQFYAVTEAPDEKADEGLRPYSFVVVRVFNGRMPDKPLLVERIIGPVRGKEDWTDLFSIFRKYASSPPAAYYCWQNDCAGKYSPAGDPDPRDPYPPEMPDHPGITTPGGFAVTPVPAGSYILRSRPAPGTGGSGLDDANGSGGCNFVPRGKTVLTADIVERLREKAGAVGRALAAVPDVPDAPKEYPSSYRQPPFTDPLKDDTKK